MRNSALQNVFALQKHIHFHIWLLWHYIGACWQAWCVDDDETPEEAATQQSAW